MEILSKNIASSVSLPSGISCLITMIKAAGDAPLLYNMKMIEDLGSMFTTPNSKEKKHFALYECPYCGNPFKTLKTHVDTGKVKSCGCYSAQLARIRATKHGMRRSILYNRWSAMISRVSNPNVNCYHRYGGRGITVCPEWRVFRNFMEWAFANGYEEGFDLEIDRIDNDGNYEPSNCRFTTHSINAKNREKSVDYAIYPNGNRFYVLFNWKGDRHYLGFFKTKEAAREARDKFLQNQKNDMNG